MDGYASRANNTSSRLNYKQRGKNLGTICLYYKNKFESEINMPNFTRDVLYFRRRVSKRTFRRKKFREKDRDCFSKKCTRKEFFTWAGKSALSKYDRKAVIEEICDRFPHVLFETCSEHA